MTRERVEQAIETVRSTLERFESPDDGSDAVFGPDDVTLALEALTTLSNALAESEKERERLREAIHDLPSHGWEHIDTSGLPKGATMATAVGSLSVDAVARLKRLSPDSQEKRDGS